MADIAVLQGAGGRRELGENHYKIWYESQSVQKVKLLSCLYSQGKEEVRYGHFDLESHDKRGMECSTIVLYEREKNWTLVSAVKKDVVLRKVGISPSGLDTRSSAEISGETIAKPEYEASHESMTVCPDGNAVC